MASVMDYSSHRRDEQEFNLREWDRKARITRENPNSRRFSASHIRSFREDATSFKSNLTISSTASSPGYSLKDEIDPSTYSFTTALKALQARAVYNSWDWLTPDGSALNSKWNEAEKYICNPLSGEVPLECLSAKTLSGRSFRNLTRKITMSAPLLYPVHPPQFIHTKPTSIEVVQEEDQIKDAPVTTSENKVESVKKDVGTQSRSAGVSSGSLSPTGTPPITERQLNRHVEACDSPVEPAVRLTDEQQMVKIKVKEKEEKGEEKEERRSKREENDEEEGKEKEKVKSGCLSWFRKRQRENKHNHPRRKNNSFFLIYVPHLKGC